MKYVNATKVTAANGITFGVRIVDVGDSYGYNFGQINNDRPMVEFYDTRYPHTSFGQFVARYYLSSLLDSSRGSLADSGLCLDMGIADWRIDGPTMRKVLDFISG